MEKILKGFEVVDDHTFDGELLIPLQAPYVECYQEIGEPTDAMIGIGGLKASTDRNRIVAAKELREYVGSEVWLHGFGWGATDAFVVEVEGDECPASVA